MRDVIARMEHNRIGQIARLGLDHPDAIPLWFGESDIVTPDFIQEALRMALAEGHTFYVHRRGLPQLREALVEYYRVTLGSEVASERITVTGSGMTSVMIALQLLAGDGDNIVVVSPIWPNIFYAINATGAATRHVRLRPEGYRWSLDLDELWAACDSRTRAVFVASPGNPTGWILEQEQMSSLVDLSRQMGIWLLSDEVYGRIVLDRDRRAPSVLDVSEPDDQVMVIQSFSKNWAMTGWRLGWLVHPVGVADAVGDLSAVNNTGATSFVQHAGITALRDGEALVERVRQRCLQGRNLVTSALGASERVHLTESQGAFYSFFSIDGVIDDLECAKTLLRKWGVGLAPGSAFGPQNESFFRLCYAKSPETLGKALDRLRTALREL